MNPVLPNPPADAQSASLFLQNLIRNEIDKYDGWVPFSRFMELALYAPVYGYYTGGSHKIGVAGDFITAPALSSLFDRSLAKQINDLLSKTAGTVYEFGAGTGELAATLLPQLVNGGLQHYCIIEVSPELAERQRQRIRQSVPEWADKVIHLTELPDTFDGIIIGNEVLDAMPCEVVRYGENGFEQAGVSLNISDRHFEWDYRPLADSALLATAAAYLPPLPGYTSELHPAQHAFVRTLAGKLVRGAIILIDYGFDAAQYYHPQRNQGTLIGHYRHHTVHDPFFYPGLTDLTAHVNFTDIAQAGTDGGLDLIGYATQANFLLNLGITDLLEACGASDSTTYLREAAALHKLIGQHEMGELFKVIAFGRGVEVDWQGFAYGDICHKL